MMLNRAPARGLRGTEGLGSDPLKEGKSRAGTIQADADGSGNLFQAAGSAVRGQGGEKIYGSSTFSRR